MLSPSDCARNASRLTDAHHSHPRTPLGRCNDPESMRIPRLRAIDPLCVLCIWTAQTNSAWTVSGDSVHRFRPVARRTRAGVRGMSRSFARINKTKRVHLAAIERLLELCTAAHRSAVEAQRSNRAISLPPRLMMRFRLVSKRSICHPDANHEAGRHRFPTATASVD